MYCVSCALCCPPTTSLFRQFLEAAVGFLFSKLIHFSPLPSLSSSSSFIYYSEISVFILWDDADDRIWKSLFARHRSERGRERRLWMYPTMQSVLCITHKDRFPFPLPCVLHFLLISSFSTFRGSWRVMRLSPAAKSSRIHIYPVLSVNTQLANSGCLFLFFLLFFGRPDSTYRHPSRG